MQPVIFFVSIRAEEKAVNDIVDKYLFGIKESSVNAQIKRRKVQYKTVRYLNCKYIDH